MKNAQQSVRFLLLTIFILAGSFSQGLAQQTLTFSRPEGLLADISEQVLKEAYQRLGINTKYVILPAERALMASNRGEVDGEVMRRKDIEKTYKNLVIVPVSVVKLEGMAFVKKVSFKLAGWDSIKPYTIGIEIGVKWAEDGTKGLKAVPVAHLTQAFSMLDVGRNDVVLASRIDGLQTIKNLKLKEIKALEPPLTTIQLFHFVHSKNVALIPKITKVLQDMEKEGRIQKIENQAAAKLLTM
jgi:polar amino acid transport system substrate-binding protein